MIGQKRPFSYEFGWPLGMPLVKNLGNRIWEVPSNFREGIARVLFTMYKKSKKFEVNMKERNKHLGSSFDDFLEEEGILEEATEIANKRVYVFQLKKEMKKKNITKSKLAEKMKTSRMQVDRVLNPQIPSTLKTLSRAAKAVGKKATIMLI